MSQYSHYRESRYRSHQSQNDYRYPRAKSKIMGVCAGIARQFDWDVSMVRVVAVISLFVFTAPTFIAYIVAGALFY